MKEDSRERRLEILAETLALPTAPLHEHRVIEHVRKRAKALGFEWVEDIYGNIVIEYQKGPKVPAIGLSAHMDHPGFEIESEEGSLARMALLGGGVPPKPGDKLLLFSDAGETRIQVESLIYPEDEKADPEKRKPSHVLASGFPSGAGDAFAMYDLVPFARKETRIESRAIDDLAGCAALLALLETLAERRPVAHVWIVFTRAEEIGFIGACGLAMSRLLPANLPLISLEASRKLPGAEQGKGVVIRVGDRRSIFDTILTSFLEKTAERLVKETPGFSFQKRILDGGTCESSLFQNFGYPSSGLAVPLGCYHNNGERFHIEAEYIDLEDWHGMVSLLWAAMTNTELLTGWEDSMRAFFVGKFEKYRDRIVHGKKNSKGLS